MTTTLTLILTRALLSDEAASRSTECTCGPSCTCVDCGCGCGD